MVLYDEGILVLLVMGKIMVIIGNIVLAAYIMIVCGSVIQSSQQL